MSIEESSHLTALGWDANWAAAFHAAVNSSGLGDAGRVEPARVVAEHRDRYVIVGHEGESAAVLSGRARHTANVRTELPAVGDWVGVSRGTGDGTAIVRVVVPRRSSFVRKLAGTTTEAQVVAANVDIALITTALPGDLNTRRLERYLTLAWESGATPLVVLTKADLCNDVDAAIAEAGLATPGAEVVAISAATGLGIERLTSLLVPGRTAVLLGSSGVGKSTLVNRLLGVERQKTSSTTEEGKGRHTTTHRELIRLENGALLIDTPGMRELQLWSADDGLDTAFADIDVFASECRFRDCVHAEEPGCAVRAAVESGALGAERLDHWHQLRRELAYLARKQDDRALSEQRARIRGVMREARRHQRRKYGDA